MKRFIRGNAAPETALTLSFTLLVLFGVIQLATTSFYQISADGAAFVGAHDTVANFGSPTSANASDAATSAQIAFKRILATSVSAVNPNNQTFETDVNQSIPGISALGNPISLTASSRLIEASSGTNAALPAPDCVQAATSITNKGTAGATTAASGTAGTANGVTGTISTMPIGLIGVGTVLTTPTTPGVGITFTGTPVLSKLQGGYDPIAPDLSGAVATLQGITTTLNALPIVGPALETKLGPILNADLEAALGGVFNSTTAINQVTAVLSGVPGVGTVLTSLTGATGLLGANGPLAAMSGAEGALDAADSAASGALSAACKTILAGS